MCILSKIVNSVVGAKVGSGAPSTNVMGWGGLVFHSALLDMFTSRHRRCCDDGSTQDIEMKRHDCQMRFFSSAAITSPPPLVKVCRDASSMSNLSAGSPRCHSKNLGRKPSSVDPGHRASMCDAALAVRARIWQSQLTYRELKSDRQRLRRNRPRHGRLRHRCYWWYQASCWSGSARQTPEGLSMVAWRTTRRCLPSWWPSWELGAATLCIIAVTVSIVA
jgi:hypothetical protein